MSARARRSRRPRPVCPARFAGHGLYALLVVAAVACAATVKTDGYVANILMQAATYAIAVFGLSVVLGLCGQINLAQAAFFALGAYASASARPTTACPSGFASRRASRSRFASGAAAGPLDAAAGRPLPRDGHDLLPADPDRRAHQRDRLHPRARWRQLDRAARAVRLGAGLSRPRRRRSSRFPAISSGAWPNTRLGRAMRAVRDNELAASAAGIDVFRTKVDRLRALRAGSAASAAGCSRAVFPTSAPTSSRFPIRSCCLTMALLGGVASPIGSAIGTGLLILIPEWLRFLKSVPGLYLAIYGAAVILIVVFMPDGIWGFIGRLFRPRARAAPDRRAARAAPRRSGDGVAAEPRGPPAGAASCWRCAARQIFRRPEGGRRRRFHRAARRRARADRPQRQRQDDDAQRGHRPLSRDRGRDPRRRRRRHRAARA